MKKEKIENWDELSDKERRIAIAKDVIEQLTAKNIIAQTGVYADIQEEAEFYDSIEGQSYFYSDTIIKRIQKPCKACAIGTAFLSLCRIDGNFRVNNVGHLPSDEMFRRLLPIFTPSQLALIETAFETSEMEGSLDESCFAMEDEEWERENELFHESSDDAIDFGYQHESNDQRLIAIMQNIIDNDGEFRPWLYDE